MFAGSLFALHWLRGTWYSPPPDPQLRDLNGDIVNIGDKVKIVGTVVGINPRDYQHGSVSILPDYPGQSILGVDSLGVMLEAE